jgi:hypothetical protein
MKIYVRQVIDEENQKRVICGFVEFSYQGENSNNMFIDEISVKLIDEKELFFSAAYEKETKNTSVFAREDEYHIFTAIFNWDYVATCFAFRATNGTLTELFFEK